VQIAEQIADYLLHGAVTNAVNMPSISADDAPKLKPYMQLATQIGTLAGQITEGGIKPIEVSFQGDVASLNVKPLTAAVLAATLGAMVDGVNMVSAPAIARARGITVTESRTDTAGDFHTAMSIALETDKGRITIAGTLFSGQPRIVSVDGVPIEAAVTPHMLLIRNQDKPGLIGSVGTILAEAKINIADFRLGRVTQGKTAVALVSVDQEVPDAVLAKLAALPQADAVKRLKF
jgi:D-3-phosphoglycerate dehydrogenase